jgi:hypothetical protein
MVLGLRTRPEHRAPSRGGPGRGVVEEAPAATAREEKRGREERGRMSGWVGFRGFHILHPRCAPAVEGPKRRTREGGVNGSQEKFYSRIRPMNPISLVHLRKLLLPSPRSH